MRNGMQSIKGFDPVTGVLLFVIHREAPEPEPVDVLTYLQEARYVEKQALKQCLRHVSSSSYDMLVSSSSEGGAQAVS